MAETKLGILIEAKDKASRKLRDVGDNLERVNDRNKRLAPSFKKIAAIGVLAFAAIGAAVVGVIKNIASFESRLGDISTLISGDSTEAIDGLRKGILEMSKTIPKSADDLGASAYAIFSAGITDTSEAIDVLENSAKLATAGLGTTEEATTLMVLALNNFKDSELTAEDAADILFKTVKNGITTVADMSQSFGLLAPLFQDVGGDLAEMSAATAALTGVNKSASISQNAIKAGLVAMSKPTKEAQGLLNELGVETFAQLVEKTGGVIAAWDAMKEATDGNTQEFAKAIGSGEALTAIISLLGGQSEAFTTALDDMTTGSNAVEEAFKKQTEQFEKQWQLLKNNVNVEMQKLGSFILPFVTDALTNLNEIGLSGVIDKFKDLVDWVKEQISQFDQATGLITTMREAWENITIVFTQNLLPALAELWTAIEPLKPYFEEFAKVIGVMFVGALFFLIKALEGAILVFISLLTWSTDVATFFTTAFTKAIDWLGDKFSGLLDMINGVIDAFKRFSTARAGGAGFFSSVGSAVGLAEGGIVTRPTLAMIGEGGEAEAVIPLSKLGRIGGGGNITINVNGGNYLSEDAGRMFGNEIIEELRRNIKI